MQVANLSRNALEMTIDRLNALSLVDTLAGIECYSVHPLTRAYIQNDLLTNKKIANKLETAFVDYWINYVYKHNENKNDSYSLLDAHWSNIKMAGDWLLKKTGLKKKVKDEDVALMFLGLNSSLEDYLLMGGRWDERKKMNSDGYDIAVALGDQDSAGWSAYHVAWIDGPYGRNLPHMAKPWVDKCTKIWFKSEDHNMRREAIRLRGLTAMQLKRYKISERNLKDSLTLSRKAKEKYDVMNVLNDLGKLMFEQERINEAKKYFQQALKIAQGIKSKEGRAFSGANLGEVTLKQNHLNDANKIFKAAFPLAQKVGRVDLIARIKCGLALIWESKGRYEKALVLAKDGLMFYQKLHHPNKLNAQELVNRLEKKFITKE